MAELPTRDYARGILILRNVQVANNEDGIAVVRAYVNGTLMTEAEWKEHLDDLEPEDDFQDPRAWGEYPPLGSADITPT